MSTRRQILLHVRCIVRALFRGGENRWRWHWDGIWRALKTRGARVRSPRQLFAIEAPMLSGKPPPP